MQELWGLLHRLTLLLFDCSEEDESDGETVSKAKKSDDSGSKVPLVNRIVKTKGELGLEVYRFENVVFQIPFKSKITHM